MNREVLKSMDTDRIPVERLISLLQTIYAETCGKGPA